MQLPYANLQMKHWNPGAEMPLILPVHLICNTSDEVIYDNIRRNSHAHSTGWLDVTPAHDGVAILCGSGPSLADTVGEIRAKQEAGGKVFAMNGAAKFLNERGIVPDYQVIIDAREETASLIGPAKHHLFASQVHPECFRRKPDAQLWHLQVENIDDLLPETQPSHCMVGGAASVGNTSTCLVYAMGYRDLQIYGYDSSHRDGEGHAFRQKMNDGDPCAVVRFRDKEYTCSLTMKLQAERFQETARHLQALGCKIEVHGSGLLPDMWNAPVETLTEAEKYQRMWAHAEYRELSPGELCADTFLEKVKPEGVVIDFGCGTGRGALKIFRAGCEVMLLDFAENCRDQEARRLPFLQCDLTERIPLAAPYGFCADVMEHIPPDDVAKVIQNIMGAADTVFFQISTVPDLAGALIGHALHLSVHDHEWWKSRFKCLGYAVTYEERGDIASTFIVRNDA